MTFSGVLRKRKSFFKKWMEAALQPSDHFVMGLQILKRTKLDLIQSMIYMDQISWIQFGIWVLWNTPLVDISIELFTFNLIYFAWSVTSSSDPINVGCLGFCTIVLCFALKAPADIKFLMIILGWLYTISLSRLFVPAKVSGQTYYLISSSCIPHNSLQISCNLLYHKYSGLFFVPL